MAVSLYVRAEVVTGVNAELEPVKEIEPLLPKPLLVIVIVWAIAF